MDTTSEADAPLAARLGHVQAEIAQAARAAGRDPTSVRLVVVTKAAPPSIFDGLARLGVSDVGESRVQTAAERMAGHERSFRWHLVGHLQGNKARRAVALFDVFHGVDSLALLERIERVAGELGRRPECLLQFNVSGEPSKHGLPPDALPELLQAADGLQHARVTGLMTMAPRSTDPARARPTFAELAALAREHAPTTLRQLSMGMSEDFPVAVQEGATLVRVGRRIVAPSDMG
ncbi:MAG: YggS family pyridoxal phosphate-dependent enzyme [Planctomycetota bacterium]|nr:MAG: YggS family pyridoxal phosphate-dependent enzyme [Planctomycetota bacterium]